MDEAGQQRGMDEVMADLLGTPSPKRCTGHNRSGGPCGNPPTPGSTVCGNHGGEAPQTVAKARQRSEERQAVMDARRSVLEMTDQELVAEFGDPAEALQWVFAFARALASRMHAEIADMRDLTYTDVTGNVHVHGGVTAALKAADLAATHAEKALRLNLDRRGLELQEKQIALLDRALDTALMQAGITADAQRAVRTVLRAEILKAADGTETVAVR